MSVNKIWDTSYIFHFQYQPQVSPILHYMLGANLGLLLYGEVSVMNVLNELFFKLLRMLPLQAIFQSLDGKYFLFYFTWNFSYIHAKSAISQ